MLAFVKVEKHMCGFEGPVNGCARGKLSVVVRGSQFHGGGDGVGAAEHGLSCLVEVRACNMDEKESPTHWQLFQLLSLGRPILVA